MCVVAIIETANGVDYEVRRPDDGRVRAVGCAYATAAEAERDARQSARALRLRVDRILRESECAA